MNRRGVTLVELLIGLVLLVMLGIAITRTLTTSSRALARAINGLAVTRTMVATGALLREELGSSDASEVRLSSSSGVEFSRTVGGAAVCGAPGSVVRLPAQQWSGARLPQPGRDEAVVLTDLLSGEWSVVPITAVGVGGCPDGSPAILITLGAAVGAAAYLRIAEPVHLRAYLSGGSGWWGLAPAGGASPIQPFAGPLDQPLLPPTLSTAGLFLPFRPRFGSDTVLRIPLGLP